MPMDMVDLYVADFINKNELLRKYYIWRENNYPDLPFKEKNPYLSDRDEWLISKILDN